MQKKSVFEIDHMYESDVSPADDLSPEDQAWVENELAHGNVWAWCMVRVTANVQGCNLVGESYLGCCSYRSQQDFIDSGYYHDMCAEALQDLEDQATQALAAIAQYKTAEIID